MRITLHKTIPLLAAGLLISSISQSALAQDKLSAKAPDKLTWQNYDQVADYASESQAEQIYHTISWKDTVVDAQQAGYKSDKPILLVLFFGDPRANC